jgi:hypothetical protein
MTSSPVRKGARLPMRTRRFGRRPRDAEEEAFEAFAAVSPVTMSGLRAAIHYFLEFDLHFLPAGSTDSFLTALLASPLLAIGRA